MRQAQADSSNGFRHNAAKVAIPEGGSSPQKDNVLDSISKLILLGSKMIGIWLLFLGTSFVSEIKLGKASNVKATTPSQTSQVLLNATDALEIILPSTNSTNSSAHLLQEPIVRCSYFYGRGDHAASCIDVIRHSRWNPGSPNRALSWGWRGHGQVDVPMPQRVSSCKRPTHLGISSQLMSITMDVADGECMLEVDRGPSPAGQRPPRIAHASQNEVQMAALAIVEKCQRQADPQGGQAEHISE